jgi:hypothetical protein
MFQVGTRAGILCIPFVQHLSAFHIKVAYALASFPRIAA